MKTIKNILLIMISIFLMCSCEKDKDQEPDQEKNQENDQGKVQENVKTTSYFDYADFITNGLVAYYPFNGNANDSIGKGLNGTAKNVSYSSDRFDQSNRACLFNGINSCIEIDNSQLLNGNAYTICFWYKADLTDTLKQSIISKSDTARYGFTLGISNLHHSPELGFAYKDKNTGAECVWVSLGLSKWVEGRESEFEFAAVAFSETDYIDYFGGKVGKNTPALFFNANTHKLFIGKSANARYKNFTGELDDLLIYNRILTHDEINKLSKWNKK